MFAKYIKFMEIPVQIAIHVVISTFWHNDNWGATLLGWPLVKTKKQFTHFILRYPLPDQRSCPTSDLRPDPIAITLSFKCLEDPGDFSTSWILSSTAAGAGYQGWSIDYPKITPSPPPAHPAHCTPPRCQKVTLGHALWPGECDPVMHHATDGRYWVWTCPGVWVYQGYYVG